MNITVLVITHRKGRLLRRSLAAVQGQLAPGDEVLVIDDGGDDREAASHFPFRYIAVPHRGYRLASLQNLGAILAENDYIVKLDGDCLPQPGWLAAYRELLAPGRLVAGRIDWRLPDGTIKNDWRFTPAGGVSPAAREWKGEFYLPHRVWGGNWGLYRPDLLRLGGFSPEFDGTWGGEESDLGWRYHYAGKEIIFAPAARVIHQHHPPNRARAGAARNRELVESRRERYQTGWLPPALSPPKLDVLMVHLGLRSPAETIVPSLGRLLDQRLGAVSLRFLVVLQRALDLEPWVRAVLAGREHWLISIPENRGLAWPKAWAQARCRGWLATVDDDMFLPPDGLAWLLGALWGTDYGGAVLYSDDLRTGDFQVEHGHLRVIPKWDTPFVEVDYAGLGCSLFPPATLRECRFDGGFFVGGVDLDFCWQCHQRGRRLIVVTGIQAEHRPIRPPAYLRERFGRVREAWQRIKDKWGFAVDL